jgi:hypothetical protein
MMVGDAQLLHQQGFASSPPPMYSASPPAMYSASPPAYGGMPGCAGGMHHPVYYSTSPPAPGFYASPPLALSPPSVQMLTIAMGGSQPGTVSSSPPMGYPMAAQPMAAQPMAVPGQMLFAQQYMSPDGSSYGVQMAVSPPARDIGGYGYGGGIDITGVAHHDESGGSAGGGGYVSGEAPPPQHYPGAHGFYGQDGQYYVNPGVVAAPQTGYEYQLGMQQGYYAGLQSGAYAAPAPGVGPQMTLRVNTANGGGDANGYAAHQQQPQGGNAQHWQRNSNAGGRGPERGRRRSGSGATGGKLQHSSGSGSSAHSFGSGDGEPGSPKVERHRGRRGRGGGNGGDSVDSKTDGQQGLEELSFEELSFAD